MIDDGDVAYNKDTVNKFTDIIQFSRKLLDEFSVLEGAGANPQGRTLYSASSYLKNGQLSDKVQFDVLPMLS